MGGQNPRKKPVSINKKKAEDCTPNFWAPGSAAHHQFRPLLARFSKASWRRFELTLKTLSALIRKLTLSSLISEDFPSN